MLVDLACRVDMKNTKIHSVLEDPRANRGPRAYKKLALDVFCAATKLKASLQCIVS